MTAHEDYARINLRYLQLSLKLQNLQAYLSAVRRQTITGRREIPKVDDDSGRLPDCKAGLWTSLPLQIHTIGEVQ